MKKQKTKDWASQLEDFFESEVKALNRAHAEDLSRDGWFTVYDYSQKVNVPLSTAIGRLNKNPSLETKLFKVGSPSRDVRYYRPLDFSR